VQGVAALPLLCSVCHYTFPLGSILPSACLPLLLFWNRRDGLGFLRFHLFKSNGLFPSALLPSIVTAAFVANSLLIAVPCTFLHAWDGQGERGCLCTVRAALLHRPLCTRARAGVAESGNTRALPRAKRTHTRTLRGLPRHFAATGGRRAFYLCPPAGGTCSASMYPSLRLLPLPSIHFHRATPRQHCFPHISWAFLLFSLQYFGGRTFMGYLATCPKRQQCLITALKRQARMRPACYHLLPHVPARRPTKTILLVGFLPADENPWRTLCRVALCEPLFFPHGANLPAFLCPAAAKHWTGLTYLCSGTGRFLSAHGFLISFCARIVLLVFAVVFWFLLCSYMFCLLFSLQVSHSVLLLFAFCLSGCCTSLRITFVKRRKDDVRGRDVGFCDGRLVSCAV